MFPKPPYLSPAALLDEANREMALVSAVSLFNDSQYQKLREKWCAAKFGLGYSQFIAPCEVAISNSQQRIDADFFLQSDATIFAFQLAEAQEPERKRGAEYKQFARHEIRSIPYEPERGSVEGPEWIANAIRKKVEKKYDGSSTLNLAIYANFSAINLQHSSVTAQCEPFKQTFASIWVITNTHFTCLFGDGERNMKCGWGAVETA